MPLPTPADQWLLTQIQDGRGNLTGEITSEKTGLRLCKLSADVCGSTYPELAARFRLMATAPRVLHALNHLQANPNDPAMHRLALDAIAAATA